MSARNAFPTFEIARQNGSLGLDHVEARRGLKVCFQKSESRKPTDRFRP
jgi:hypothetical protein